MAEQITLKEALAQLRSDLRDALGREPVCVELGSGQRPEEGFISVDRKGADVECDLFEFPWPFDDGSVDFIFSSHFLEHVPDWDGFWGECYRVISDGGIVVMLTPYWSSVRAFQDPDHKQAISEARYQYLSRDWRKVNKVDHYGVVGDVNFEFFARPWLNWHKDFADKSDAAQKYAKEHYLNAVEDIVVFLRAQKDGVEMVDESFGTSIT